MPTFAMTEPNLKYYPTTDYYHFTCAFVKGIDHIYNNPSLADHQI